jgi:hypothetical protein
MSREPSMNIEADEKSRVDQQSPRLLVIGLIFTAIGIGLIGKFAFDIIGAVGAGNWPTVQGTVLSSRVERIDLKDRDDTYEAQVRYTYEVGGKAYTNDAIKFGYQAETKGGAESLAANYPAGKVIDVYYDPASPGRSVLETGITFNPVLPCISPFIVLLGFYMVRVGLRQMRGAA